MNKRLKAEIALLSKPGDTIQETIDIIDMSQAQLAERMGKTASKIHDLITGKEPITVTTALQLEKVLGIDAPFWLNSENNYREKLARLDAEEQMEANLDWVKQFPVKALIGCGYLSEPKANAKQSDELLKFFGVASAAIWQKMYEQEIASIVDFRKSETTPQTLAAITAWMRVGELEVRKMDLPEYDKEAFKRALSGSIKDLVATHPDDFSEQLQNICKAAGVALVYTQCFPKAPICGASRWIGNHPLIQLTDRYKTNDQFWFTFYHEAAHLLLHGKKEIFVEPVTQRQGSTSEKEAQANDFAAKMLLPDRAVKELGSNPSENDIVKLAKQYNTHPGIVLGRLQHLKLVHFSFGVGLKKKVNLFGITE
ncbi:MAG: ImmA/IrrE family metallo-endopeptidase [Bacteroidota bacterium]